MNNVENVISQLEKQRSAIDRALSALQEISGSRASGADHTTRTTNRRKKRHLSPEGRRRIIEATKKRWATVNSAVPVQSAPTKRTMSASARRRIAAAQRKRWAAVKKSQAQAKSAAKPAVPKKRKLSAAARKRMADATRKRWAAYRKAAGEKAKPVAKAATAVGS